jgi:hypothetical protein
MGHTTQDPQWAYRESVRVYNDDAKRVLTSNEDQQLPNTDHRPDKMTAHLH